MAQPHRIVRRVLRFTFLAALFAVVNCGLPSCDSTHDSAFSTQHLLTAQRGDLKSTTITPVLSEPISAGRNVLWCGTFQLAWNEVRTLVGEDLHFDNDPPMATALNNGGFSRRDLDDDSFVALAGFVRGGIFARIDSALKAKFRGQASPHYLPPPSLTPRPQDIVAYSYLFKHLEFAVPFEKVDQGMSFKGRSVEAFGLPTWKPDHASRYTQVLIHDYRSADDFVIELKSTAAGDRLILAKVPPGDTLAATAAAVQKRLTTRPEAMSTGDTLLAPKMNFDLTSDYHELCGRHLVVANPKVAKDLLILSAVQNIRFQIDEKGVRLRSESHVSFGCSAEYSPRPKHVLIFDQPFVVLMQRQAASNPYFALWVSNAELLEKR
ncbi:MAG: hypothetical protein PHU85_05230 [Phycisphaerae bacterium]|nr:hypothetical protein [Phycisphaerae bacterium]